LASWRLGVCPLEIHVDLRARTARARVGHLPEIVLVAEAVDPRVGQSGDLPPEAAGLVVLVVHADADARGGDPQPPLARHELPGEGDRVALEVVAEGEVPEHLEEGVVAVGVPHLLEVVVLAAGAHALLRRGGAAVVAVLEAEEGALELHHPRVREEEGGIVGRDERRGRHLAVGALHEEIEEATADLIGSHRDEER
jgi:hypothetical protein